MYLKKNSGLTLIESVVAIALLGTVLISILGAFFISKISTLRARHRMSAMNRIKEYMESEVRAGYLGGYVDGDYYVTVASGAGVSVTVDDRGTSTTSDDLVGTLTPSPYPATITTVGTISYKTVGFFIQWNEDAFGSGAAPQCSERALTYVAERS